MPVNLFKPKKPSKEDTEGIPASPFQNLPKGWTAKVTQTVPKPIETDDAASLLDKMKAALVATKSDASWETVAGPPPMPDDYLTPVLSGNGKSPDGEFTLDWWAYAKKSGAPVLTENPTPNMDSISMSLGKFPKDVSVGYLPPAPHPNEKDEKVDLSAIQEFEAKGIDMTSAINTLFGAGSTKFDGTSTKFNGTSSMKSSGDEFTIDLLMTQKDWEQSPLLPPSLHSNALFNLIKHHPDMADGNYHHVTATGKGGELKMHIDGILVGVAPVSMLSKTSLLKTKKESNTKSPDHVTILEYVKHQKGTP